MATSPYYGLGSRFQQQPQQPLYIQNPDGSYAPAPKPETTIGGGLASRIGNALVNSKKEKAADIRARLVRRDFEDWKQRFLPIEQRVRAAYNNPQQLQAAMQQSRGLVRQGFDVADAEFRRRQRGFGIAMTPGQEQSYRRESELNRGLADIEAINRTARRFRDRDTQLLTGAPRQSATELARGMNK